MKPCQIKIILGLVLACVFAIGAILLLVLDKDWWFLLLVAAFIIGQSSLEIDCE